MGDGWTKLPEETMTTLPREAATSNLSISSSQFSMAVKALSLLVRVDGLVDDIVVDSATQPTAVLLSLLELPQTSEVRFCHLSQMLCRSSCSNYLLTIVSLCRHFIWDVIFCRF